MCRDTNVKGNREMSQMWASNQKRACMLSHFSHVRLCGSHARLLCPRDSPGKNTRVGVPCPSPGDLPDPGIEPGPLGSRNRKHIVAKPNLATEYRGSERKCFRLTEKLALFFLIQHFILWQKQFRLLKGKQPTLNTVSPPHVNEFCSEDAFQSPTKLA